MSPGSAPVSGAGFGVPPERTFATHSLQSNGCRESDCTTKVRGGGTPPPAPETGALPGAFRPRVDLRTRTVR